MAEAKQNTRTITEKTVTLTLSVEEAEALVAITSRVGGHQSRSPRQHTDAVMAALKKAGVRAHNAFGAHPAKHLDDNAEGLYFAEKPGGRQSAELLTSVLAF
ncbi:hypothetical protein [Streptomyces sp. H27-H5]|uniref:hypothetical protein n=1 Tax=Streptomyces sp. H27-H5 TaxID=2996460 RepID=UPI0022721A75|nr:hypothetical protein [Streptomyces sp. H27-H5]MCY0963018.1 hypothetical protein [Streptomyces sp. H27-H5]